VRIDKLQVLTNCLTYKIYEHTDECETYEEATGLVADVLIKTPNEVFAQHLLATTKQQPG